MQTRSLEAISVILYLDTRERDALLGCIRRPIAVVIVDVSSGGR